MGCPACGAETALVHGYRERMAADVPTAPGRGPRPGLPDALPEFAWQTAEEQVQGVLDRY
jgi:hypothetical protein